ncbi:LacI family DNA-binding transcriptional regulator [Sphingomonas sp.]|jgi:LacI family transcriptional regulator|uniref:LacI family DNA-binding transcriptional regulator n=1 Tax=Sphingomonas sp. TaxID=28214 RepID=UPI002D80C286|nr:LacI family DNA-binding transcriptional regulator [Sphingomonas sp.]HEU0043945.1 LacI family DNA-binding transcriptional regulator [Sphingomonas sp.]
MARTTISDVSRAAGVSIKTVSRVLNNERYVGADTRAKVEAAVAALRFRPSTAARSLAGGRSHQIGLMCDNPSAFYVHQMQLGVRDRCSEAGVRMIAQPYDRHGADAIEEIAQLIDTTRVDALVLTPPITDDPVLLDRLVERGIAFVRVAPGIGPDVSPSVFIDNAAAAGAVVRHLRELGHRRIGHVGGDPSFAASARRRAGFVAVAGDDPRLLRDGDFTFAAGLAAGAELLALPEPPTAIVAANDEMAAGILSAAHRLGVAVPGALSVAGFGDDAVAGVVWPQLTTVRQPTRALGYQAADILLDPGGARHRELPWTLVVRDSTGPAP